MKKIYSLGYVYLLQYLVCYFLYYQVQTSINLFSKNNVSARNEIKYNVINKVYNTGRAMLTPTKLVVKG